MPSIHDLFTFYLRPENLQGRTAVVTIEDCIVEEIFNPRIRRNEPRLIVRFHGKKLRLCCNKTQAERLMEITKTDNYAHWKGHTVALSPATAPNGKATISISAPPRHIADAKAIDEAEPVAAEETSATTGAD
jgi:hypothetical protein